MLVLVSSSEQFWFIARIQCGSLWINICLCVSRPADSVWICCGVQPVIDHCVMETLFLAIPCYYSEEEKMNAAHMLLFLLPFSFAVFFFLLIIVLFFFYRLSIPNMEDLKRRILKIVSNCNKPKVRTTQTTGIGTVLHLNTTGQYHKVQTVILHIFPVCVAVPHPAAGMLVRAVWREPRWLPHRDGRQKGAGAEPAAAGGGVTDHSSIVILPELCIRWFSRPHGHPLASVPARARAAYHRRRAVTEVCLQMFHVALNSIYQHLL